MLSKRNVAFCWMHAGGRPTKRTPEITAKICEALSYGLSHEEVAALVGINDDTLFAWKKIPEFAEQMKGAIAARNLIRLKKIETGAFGWQGTAWAMERQYPLRYSKPEVQLQINMNGDIPAGMGPNEYRLRQEMEIRKTLRDKEADAHAQPAGD